MNTMIGLQMNTRIGERFTFVGGAALGKPVLRTSVSARDAVLAYYSRRAYEVELFEAHDNAPGEDHQTALSLFTGAK